jgi:acyl-CoA reductase-like NAD-dependent aldehyde dehydrogenase
MAVWKIGPALATGNTVVLKPASDTPCSALELARIIDGTDLPKGVVNVVHGAGAECGEELCTSPLVDKVALTGSTEVGRRVMQLAANTVKKVTLELGGKSAFIVLDDAPLEKAVAKGVNNAMLNSGQTCSAWTRMIVPRARLAEVLDIAAGALAKLTVGDPLDPGTKLGPLVSRAQRQRVEGYIERGVAEGARLVAGGKPSRFERGHYVEPTIFSDVTPRMAIAQEEIFGPVLAVLPYDSEEEAIAIANDTIYGLAGGVWGGDQERALRVARRMRTGQVDVNGARFNPLAPFGGYKWSGIGREFGKYGLDEYLQVKAIQC